jgi:hypothetical protein
MRTLAGKIKQIVVLSGARVYETSSLVMSPTAPDIANE